MNPLQSKATTLSLSLARPDAQRRWGGMARGNVGLLLLPPPPTQLGWTEFTSIDPMWAEQAQRTLEKHIILTLI